MIKFFKKIWDNSILVLLLSPLIIGGLFPIVLMFISIWKICNGNIVMFIINVLSIPFVILGITNIVRGFCSVVIDIDSEKFKKYWKFALYFFANIIGYTAVFLAIVQWIKFN